MICFQIYEEIGRSEEWPTPVITQSQSTSAYEQSISFGSVLVPSSKLLGEEFQTSIFTRHISKSSLINDALISAWTIFKNIYRGRQTGIMNPMNSLSNFSDDRVVSNLILPVSSLSKWFYWVNISIQLKAFCVSLDEGSCHETACVWDSKAYFLPHTDSCWIKSSYVGDNSLWLLEKNTEENSRTVSQAINY